MSNEFSADYIAQLQEELLRVCARGGAYGKFTIIDNPNYTGSKNGQPVEGATETDVIKHLTSAHDFVKGRQHRFPGVGNGWVFSSAVKAAGFRFVDARNYRGQACRVITL